MPGVLVGEVRHFYDRISVAVIVLKEPLQVGDTIHILGPSTDFKQEVASLQIEHQSIEGAGPGQEVALKVDRRTRKKDKVYKIESE